MRLKTVVSSLSVMALSAGVLNAKEGVKSFQLLSPDKNIEMTISFDEELGCLSYEVTSEKKAIFIKSPLGITTDRGDFSSRLKFVGENNVEIDETYTLPQGKVSTYINRANQKRLSFKKDGKKMDVILRVYDDGIAFRYYIPGSGAIKIIREASGFKLAEKAIYWGQSHPNNYGNENPLGRLDEKTKKFSFPLLCDMQISKHWVLLAQAATYGNYCIPHLIKGRTQPNLLYSQFPIQQIEPIKTTLPFESPWKVAVISPNDLSVIVEQTLFENLNPPIDPLLENADWIRPGRSTLDWFAGDRTNWKGWVDFNSEMGWEYHIVDDGWEGYIKDPAATVEYAKSKNVGIIAWRSTPSINTPEKIEKVFKQYNEFGFRGAKIDFFDRLPDGESRQDYEDTQMGIQLRDSLSQLGIKYKLQLVFHGAAIPTGERRKWPHLLGTEAIRGQEAHPKAKSDNCIAYTRNPLGPTDYSPVWFGRDNKTDAYQIATSVIFESGFLIFADLHKDYLNHPSKDFLKKLPSTWDEVKFIDGYPASHTVIARRKGNVWFVGGITTNQKIFDLAFDFLAKNVSYSATIFRDQESGLTANLETKEIKKGDSLQIAALDRGGFAIMFEPIDKR